MKRLLIALLLVCAITVMAQPPQATNKWEYKFVYECNEKKAAALGQEGWELAAIQSTGPGIGNNVPTYVFKRSK